MAFLHKYNTAVELLTKPITNQRQRFKKSRESSLKDDARPGRPRTSANDENIEEVKKMILANRLITIR